jgi:hypothetical protein
MSNADGGVVWRPAAQSTGIKCYPIGLHRTGTRSMSTLLSRYCSVLQYPVKYGGVDLESQIVGRERDLSFVSDLLSPALDAYDAVTDVPIPVLYRQLFHRYPTAKFILLVRNPCDWVRSVRRHVGRRKLLPFERVQYWQYLTWRPKDLSNVTDKQLLRMHVQHTADVIDFFERTSADSLGVFELRPESGQAVAAFLDIDAGAVLPLVP